MKKIHIIPYLLVLFALSACVATIPTSLFPQRTPEERDAFLEQLAREYRSMAFIEANIMQDMDDATHFVRKAQRADNDLDVLPDLPQSYDLSGHSITEIRKARLVLLEALGRAGIKNNALYLARAQTRYDCWLQQREENPEENYHPSCQGAFYEALSYVDMDTPLPVPSSKPGQEIVKNIDSPTMPKLKKPPVQRASVSASPALVLEGDKYAVHFDYNSAALNGLATTIIKDMARAHFDGQGDYQVILTGYSDGANSETNRKLAQRRTVAVKNALILYGANPAQIITGQTVVIPTAKQGGVSLMDPKARRVEVTFSVVPW